MGRIMVGRRMAHGNVQPLHRSSSSNPLDAPAGAAEVKRSLPAYCYLRKRSGGRVYVYFERGGKAIRITEEPGSTAFHVAYAKLLNGVAPIPSTRDFRGLVRSYVASKGYRKQAQRSAKDYY